jgi:amidophosphoribosyltransferase
MVQQEIQGSYSAFLLTPWGSVFIFRDQWGIRPFALGFKDGVYYAASETCAFDVLQVDYLRDIQPGEVIRLTGIEAGKVKCNSYKPTWRLPKEAACIFEFVYFARPDSLIFGSEVAPVRKNIGRQAYNEAPIEADVVISVPDSSNCQALGFSNQSRIPFDFGLIRSHYVGRTFIMPYQERRDRGVKVKFNPVRSVLNSKRVIIIEDSIVRGTTMKRIGRMVRRAGAKEVHVRVGFALIRGICSLGMDFGSPGELIARGNTSQDEIREFIEADSLAYLSIDGLLSCLPPAGYCTGCLDGRYPPGMVIPQLKKKNIH